MENHVKHRLAQHYSHRFAAKPPTRILVLSEPGKNEGSKGQKKCGVRKTWPWKQRGAVF